MVKWIILAGSLLFYLQPSQCLAQEAEFRLLNNKERIDYARTHQFPNARTVIKDSAGQVLKGFNLQFPVVGNELYSASDYYADAGGKIMEVVVRKPTAADRELIKKLFDIEEEELRGSIEFVRQDCGHQREILANVLAKELVNRKNEQVIDVELDNVQEATVVGILKQCGEPTLATAGTEGIRAVFLVLQHARRKNQEKYFYVLEDFLKNGSIRKGASASVEDRLLMASGAKQRYGTQIVFFARTGYHLYPLQDPENIDQIRAAVGMGPLELYLKDREEFYGVPIK